MAIKEIGMKSEVSIRVDLQDDISRLASSYFTPPFKVANITEDKRTNLLHLMLMCSSPGILDGDDLSIRVELEEGSRLWLHTQSYQRLFFMKQGATQRVEVRLGKGACFCWLPHPCVPHEDAIFTGVNRIFLSEGSQLLWGEVLTCGRKLRGEVFCFEKYHVRTEVFYQGELRLLENVCVRPGVLPVEMLGQMEGFTHQANMLCAGGGAMGRKEEIESFLAGREDMIYGISEGPGGSLVLRILGNKAEPLYDRLKAIAGMLMDIKPGTYAG